MLYANRKRFYEIAGIMSKSYTYLEYNDFDIIV